MMVCVGVAPGRCHQVRKEQSWEVGVMMTRSIVASGETEGKVSAALAPAWASRIRADEREAVQGGEEGKRVWGEHRFLGTNV